MAGRRTGGLGKGLDALIPNKAGGPSKEPAKKTRFRNPLNSMVFFSRCWYPIRRIILRSLQANAAGELPRWQGSRKFLLL